MEAFITHEQTRAKSKTHTSPSSDRRAEDIFFTSMAVLMLIIVFLGFASSYFLRGAMFAHLASPLVHLHGALFSSWIILFVVQSSLVSAGNVRLHRKLGVAGAVLAGLMVIIGVLTPIGTLRRGVALPPIFTPVSFLLGNIIGILVFGIYVAVAIWKRNNRTVHKRLLFMANAMLLPPALARMAFPVVHHPSITYPLMVHDPFLIGVIPLAMILALFIFDLVARRRVFAVTLIGGFFFSAIDPISDPIYKTQFAQHFALWAQHHP